MKNLARNHHFVAQGYLAGFTDDGTRHGKLTVFDLDSRRVFRTGPRNVAAKRDFNRVNLEGRTPDDLERSLGDFEGKAISAIRRVQERGEPLTSEALNHVVTLMTLLVVRNPRFRRAANDARRHEVRIIGDILTSDRRIYEHHVAKAKKDGFIPEHVDVPFEEMAAFIKGDQYTVEVSTTESLSLEFGIFQSIFDTLASRSWSLVTAGPDAPDFVTCDHPVAVVFRDPKRRGPIGYGLPGTEVSFPLGPRHAVVGMLEDPLVPHVTARAGEVAALNNRTLYHVDRQLYARSERVMILKRGEIAEFDVKRDRQDRSRSMTTSRSTTASTSKTGGRVMSGTVALTLP